MNRASAVAFVALVALGALSGCSTPEPTPSFSGPWGSEFAEHYSLAGNDFVRSVLEDGQVTDIEYTETVERFKTCLDEGGVTLGELNDDGSFSTTYPDSMTSDSAHSIISSCSDNSGEKLVASLYFWTTRNPTHLDEATIVIDCLRSHGFVSSTYGAEEYNRDVSTGSLDELAEQFGEEFQKCLSDPLGSLR